ncbi:hypothetical protein [Streptomyces sp. NPDC015125]|uniref:hypothetical protein n=1 Tax=Streptomyces sp. NPDC015125 TaxID=3364938 RepID=UPI003701D131
MLDFGERSEPARGARPANTMTLTLTLTRWTQVHRLIWRTYYRERAAERDRQE